MQVKKILMAGLISAITFVSCSKKSNDVVPPPAPSSLIEGTWVGKSSVLSGPYDTFYSFKIKADGTMEVLDASQQKTGEGNWKLEGLTFEANFTYSQPDNGTFSVIANFHPETGKLDGTWGTGLEEYGGGYWFMNKSN